MFRAALLIFNIYINIICQTELHQIKIKCVNNWVFYLCVLSMYTITNLAAYIILYQRISSA